MTMEIELAKRDLVKQLWDETQGDEAARDLVFGDVIDAMEAHMEEVADQREDVIRDELREDVKSDLIDDPPDALIEKVTELLLDDPPLKLVDKIKEEIRDQMEQELSDQRDDLRADTELLLNDLKDQVARLSARLEV